MPASTGHEGLGGKAAINAVVDAFHVLVEDLVGALDKFKIALKGQRKMPAFSAPSRKLSPRRKPLVKKGKAHDRE